MIVVASTTAQSGMDVAAQVLSDGGTALDAVEQGIRCVETAPDVFSVGQDAWPNLLGEHELDASIMDGATLNAGAVGALHGFVHPISVARHVMDDLVMERLDVVDDLLILHVLSSHCDLDHHALLD